VTSTEDFVIQLALDKGVITSAQVDAAREQIAQHTDLSTPPPKVAEVLLKEKVVTAMQFSKLLADHFGLQAVDVTMARIGGDMINFMSRELAARYKALPISKSGRTLRVAVSDPFDVQTLDELAHVLGLTIDPCVAPAQDIKNATERLYGKDPATMEKMLENGEDLDNLVQTNEEAEPTAGKDNDGPIIKLVHSIIMEAIQRRASDIHLEPMEKRFRVRYRVDGELLEVENPPKRLQHSIISRLKIMANISIAEKRIPQDGRIQVASTGKSLDLRVSSLPTVHGESIVMRILDKEGLSLGLPELGFFSDDRATMERLIALPDGLFLVTGPTGSGKTTTLYSCLHFINKPDKKIITVEDPVEYQLSGINQVPVRHDVGMTFSSALRSMLRQAPNIVMVGEIRDLETAEIAINASLTGHMVFSTLHTNDAPGAITRLSDIGVKPFLISTSLRAALAQRLVRTVCKKCKKPYSPDAEEIRSLNITPAQCSTATFMKGAGCPNCNGTGYRGRYGIFELFLINDEITRMIYDGIGTGPLRDKARALGMRTMREDGLRKVLAGATTIEEVVSITVGDAG
jgi:general secretion pathway protein E/type IV pilus assembly protein PilB